jgi:hypothetical protein
MLDNLEAEFPEHEPRPSNAPKALEGIRVVDFSHFIAGPFATMILADMGAGVMIFAAILPCIPTSSTARRFSGTIVTSAASASI